MKTNFTRNLFFVALLLVGVSSVKAQFMCTDVMPDSVVTCTNGQITVDIDLNNDATPDFRLNSVQSGALGFVIFQATQIGVNNFVLDDGSNNALALTLGTPINGTCTAWHAMTGLNVTMASWNGTMALGGQFPIGADRYVGLKLIVGANTYYGWARFNFSPTTNKYTFKDYGYNATNNGSIPAGQTCAACTFTPTFSMIGSGGALCPGSVLNGAKSNSVVAVTYTWSSAPAGVIFGTPNSGSSNITFPTAGTYTISLGATDNSTCTAFSTQTITINPSPTISVVSSASILCSGQTATLTASGGTSYNWGSGYTTTPTQTVAPSTSTVYVISGKNSFSCTSTITFTQNVAVCGGITEVSLNNESYLVYPNPANDKIYVSAKTNQSSVINIEVMDAYGKVIISQKQNFISAGNICTIQISQLATGIYFIKMNSDEGGNEVLRIIKQ